MEQLMRNSGEGGGGGMAALIYERDVLANFRQGGPWDAQRLGAQQRREFRDYATISIGLYAAAAGIPEREILIVQNLYAWKNSNFGNEPRDEVYAHLPKRNVENTRLGYSLYGTFETKN